MRWGRLGLWTLLLLSIGTGAGALYGWIWYSRRPVREAQQAYEAGEFALALRWANYFLREHPNDLLALRLSARSFARTANYPEAIRRYQQVPEYEAEDQFLLGYSYAQTDQAAKGQPHLEEAVSMGWHAEARRALVVVLYQLGKEARALEHAAILTEDPQEGDLGLALIGEIHFHADRPRQSYEAYSKLLQRNPDLRGIPYTKHHVLLNQVESLLKLGETQQAAQEAEKLGTFGVDAEFLEPRDRRVRGLLYFQQGEIAKAREDWEKAAAADPSDVEVLKHLGNLFAQQKDFAASAEWYSRAAELRPDDPAVHQQLAFAYSRLGDSDAAARHQQLARQGREKAALRTLANSDMK